MENITFNQTLVTENSIDCEDLTNNGLYMILLVIFILCYHLHLEHI